MNPREEELVVRSLLEQPARVDIALRERRWAELAALVRFTHRDVPVTLAHTDPALYRKLREQVTRFFLLGGDAFSLPAEKAAVMIVGGSWLWRNLKVSEGAPAGLLTNEQSSTPHRRAL